jgi:cellulose synthase/poly-beta-1,6-N-acetylglucosamine synthase-like glycosyltransferase
MRFADIQRAQQFEYHFDNLVNKPFEASFGLVNVLPGGITAYNMKAIIDYDR